MLAAPAFLASLFGDRVLSVFQVRGRLFTVIDLVIQPGDPFVDHSVRAMSVDYHLQAVAVLPAQGPPPCLSCPVACPPAIGWWPSSR